MESDYEYGRRRRSTRAEHRVGGGDHVEEANQSSADEIDDGPVEGGDHRLSVRAQVHRGSEVSERAKDSLFVGQNRKRFSNVTLRGGELLRQGHNGRESRQQHSEHFTQKSGELLRQGRNGRESQQQRSRSRSLILRCNTAHQRRSRSASLESSPRREVRESRSGSMFKRVERCYGDRRSESVATRTSERISTNYIQSSRKRYRSRSRNSSPPACRASSRCCRSKSPNAYRRSGSGATRSEHKSSDVCQHYRKRRRSRSPSFSPPARQTRNDTSMTSNILDKFLNIMENMKGQSSSKLSLSNVIPEFDPMAKEQSIIIWLTKVEECASIYGWNEKETIHFALPKLVGVAKSWYQGLDTVLFSWSEWKKKLVESFPCREDHAELLTTMLAKKVRYGESFVHYFYEKMNLLNRCSISGRKAVDCLLHGIEDRAVRVGAQAAQFRAPEEVLKYLQTVKVGSTRENDKTRQEKRINTSETKMRYNDNKHKTEQPKKILKCYNCETEGHRSFECDKTAHKCTICSKIGHLEIYCRNGRDNRTKVSNSTESEKEETQS